MFCFLQLCSPGKGQTESNFNPDGTIGLIDRFRISEDLKNISIDFINTNGIDNSIIEVAINKREPDEIYITLTCKGVAYFIVKKLTPLFTYELDNNTFFVFTGAEEILQIPFDEAKYKNRRQERCDSIMKSCYIFQDKKMQKKKIAHHLNHFQVCQHQ
ncbi:MAG: hypothetical protein IPJ81_00890 [Chitinophagaceae bacterium]|nr:hypothetical protein [Chitinophagaceae bacterium]